MATSIIKSDEIRLLNDQVVMSDGALTNNVSFPAGHVVQTTFRKYNALHSAGITSSTPSIALAHDGNQEYYGTISNLTSGNHVLIQMSFPCYVYRPMKLVGCNFQIFRDSVSNIIYGDMPSAGNRRSLFGKNFFVI